MLALYVRDASGLQVSMVPPLPALDPSVQPEFDVLVSDRAVSSQWAAWWVRLLDGGGFWPDHVAPTDFVTARQDPDVDRLFYWRSRYVGPNFPGLEASPELQSLARKHNDAATSWIGERRSEFATLSIDRSRRGLDPVGEIVRSLEHDLDRPIRPFRCDIRVLAVEGSSGWLLSPSRAIVTMNMWKDVDAYSAWLRQVIRALV